MSDSADAGEDFEIIEVEADGVDEDSNLIADDVVAVVDGDGNVLATDETIAVQTPDGDIVIDETISVANEDGDLEPVEEDITVIESDDD
jgi:hypothetical protein